MRTSTRIEHPTTGLEYHATSVLYRDGVVLTDVYRYDVKTCDLNEAHRYVIGATWRGRIAKGLYGHWFITDAQGNLLPVTFKRRRDALALTVSLALRLSDRQNGK